MTPLFGKIFGKKESDVTDEIENASYLEEKLKQAERTGKAKAREEGNRERLDLKKTDGKKGAVKDCHARVINITSVIQVG